MEDKTNTPEPDTAPARRHAINLGAFLVAFAFVWLVFDNIALGLLFAIMFAGGSEAAQRATQKGEAGDEPGA